MHIIGKNRFNLKEVRDGWAIMSGDRGVGPYTYREAKMVCAYLQIMLDTTAIDLVAAGYGDCGVWLDFSDDCYKVYEKPPPWHTTYVGQLSELVV